MTEEKQYFVPIRFQGSGKSYYFSTTFDDLKVGDLVVVDTVSGMEVATVCGALMSVEAYRGTLALKPISRKPTKDDIASYQYGLKESKKVLEITEKEVQRLGLPMNLLEANFSLDRMKVTITYTSDNRVDFRELLRNLAPLLHCRIELRQIASRDKAKMIGGLGSCGLPLCCSTFLEQFEGISIAKAKNQMLTLNIPKLSGPCGKLLCCLNFEDDLYTEAKKDFPRLGTILHLEEGDYTVAGFNIMSKMVKLSGNQSLLFMPLDDVNKVMNGTYKKPEPKLDPMPTPSFRSDNNSGGNRDNNRNQNNNQNKNGGNRPNNNNNGNRHHHHGNRNNRNNRNNGNNGKQGA